MLTAVDDRPLLTLQLERFDPSVRLCYPTATPVHHPCYLPLKTGSVHLAGWRTNIADPTLTCGYLLPLRPFPTRLHAPRHAPPLRCHRLSGHACTRWLSHAYHRASGPPPASCCLATTCVHPLPFLSRTLPHRRHLLLRHTAQTVPFRGMVTRQQSRVTTSLARVPALFSLQHRICVIWTSPALSAWRWDALMCNSPAAFLRPSRLYDSTTDSSRLMH